MAEIRKELSELRQQNCELRERLAGYQNPKNSRNSSVPPSKDENRPKKNQSLRTKSGKKVGGQPGHKGSTLEMTADPDEVIHHSPDFCEQCGNGLSDIAEEQLARRQVVDIPPVKPRYTEHRIYRKRCTCGHLCEGAFPASVKAPISYGPGVQASVAYLQTRQYMPVARTTELFRDSYNLPMSQGTISELMKDFAAKCLPAYRMIHSEAMRAAVLGADETGIKVDGKKGWFWAWQGSKVTYINYSNDRGIATIDRNFPAGVPGAILVHDCWASHFRTECVTHQLCIPHLLRELNYFIESRSSKWAVDFKKLLCQALELKKKIDPHRYADPDPERNRIMERKRELLERPLPDERNKLRAFQKRMVKYRNFIFTFLHHPEVPPDNNASERAIRNVKVKQKVSGQFKTTAGAQAYAVVRTVTDTCIKNGQNVLGAFMTIASLEPE